MADDVLKVERHPNYVTLILNRPEKRNALNQVLFEALDAELAKIEKSPDIRAVILRGEGRAFCSGIDLREIGQIGAGGAPAPERDLHPHPEAARCRRSRRCKAILSPADWCSR